jgi:hypothetical protein
LRRGESRNISLAPPAGGSHDRAGVTSGARHGELGGDGQCGGRGGLACRTRSTAWPARIRGTQHSAAGARHNDGRGTGYSAGRRPATGTPAFRVCRTGCGFGAHRGLGRTALDAPSSSASQAGRRPCWRCDHRSLVWDWLESASECARVCHAPQSRSNAGETGANWRCWRSAEPFWKPAAYAAIPPTK